MSAAIRPALQNEEWQQRRSGPVSVDTLGDETHLSCVILTETSSV